MLQFFNIPALAKRPEDENAFGECGERDPVPSSSLSLGDSRRRHGGRVDPRSTSLRRGVTCGWKRANTRMCVSRAPEAGIAVRAAVRVPAAGNKHIFNEIKQSSKMY